MSQLDRDAAAEFDRKVLRVKQKIVDLIKESTFDDRYDDDAEYEKINRRIERAEKELEQLTGSPLVYAGASENGYDARHRRATEE